MNKRITKSLKAIVFTDIVNFTKLSSEDEELALSLIDKQKKLLTPIIKSHNGHLLKEIGDGLLLSFDSTIDAVNCSIKIQRLLLTDNELNIRIGIHQGDIFVKDGDIFGDDVNIASRIESYSPNGGISISDKVNKDISGVTGIKTSFIGYRKLKGVSQDTKIYSITSHNLPKFRKQWIPYISGIFFLLLGTLGIGANIIYMIFFPDEISNMADGRVYKALVRNFSWLIFGYSNIMYVQGISSKTHRYVVYGGYIAILIFFLPFIIEIFTNGISND